MHAVKGLGGVVGLSVAHAIWDTPDGWSFGETDLSTPDLSGNGFLHLCEAYRASQPNYTRKVMVPVL
jgi:putative glutathione S-transferase